MTSNVIINFGSSAGQVFKDMHRVKSEMKAVQAQAVATTRATKIAASGGPGMFKQSLSSIRFGAGIVTGFLGINLFRELSKPIMEGFSGVVKASEGFTLAVEAAAKGLTEFGAQLGRMAISKTSSFLAQAIADALFPGGPRLAMLAEANAAVQKNAAAASGLFGEQYTSPASEQFPQKMLDLAKRQAEYLRETWHTLRRMEDDLERVNMLDPW